MTGSSLIPIVVPVMAFVAMAFWLGLVFYADSHPGYRSRKPAARSRTEMATSDGSVLDSAVLQAPENAGPTLTGPRDHERISEPALVGPAPSAP